MSNESDFILTAARGNENLRMFHEGVQPIIAAARLVNLGRLDASILQAQLDDKYGEGEIDAKAVTLKRPPTAEFTIGSDDEGVTVKSNDIAIGLDAESVRFTFDDGCVVTGFLAWHEAPVQSVRCEVNACGEVWGTIATYQEPEPEVEVEAKKPAKKAKK